MKHGGVALCVDRWGGAQLTISDQDILDRLLESVPCYVGGQFLYCDPALITGSLYAGEGGLALREVSDFRVFRGAEVFALQEPVEAGIKKRAANAGSGESFACCVCLMDSASPELCTECGARIEHLDLRDMIFVPPHQVRFKVPFSVLTEKESRRLIEYTAKRFFQHYEIVPAPDGLVIESNDIAFERLLEELSRLMTVPKDSVLDRLVVL